MKYRFYSNCVSWPEHQVDELSAMIEEATDITRATFLKHVDMEDQAQLERSLGYAPHDKTSCLRMANDYHVSYHRSKLDGKRVYYFRHSAIEYVFKGGQ